MMFLFLRHVWGSQPPQSACPIHIRHIQSVWAHWYAVHRHTAAALHSYIYPTWLRIWESGSYVESNDVVTSWLADRHLNLLPASILDIYKVFEHIDMQSIGHRHRVSALHTYITHPTWLRFWGSWSLVESNEWCHYVMSEADHSHLKLLPAYILDIYKVFWAHWYAVHMRRALYLAASVRMAVREWIKFNWS